MDSMLQKHNIYGANYDSDYDYLENNWVAVITNDRNLRELERVKMQLQFGNIDTKALVDSGSVCKICYKNLANAVVLSNKDKYWTKPSELQDLKTFLNDLIMIIGVFNITAKCNDWLAKDAKVTVVEDRCRKGSNPTSWNIHKSVKTSIKYYQKSCSDKIDIFPRIIAIERDKILKLAIYSKILNKFVHKNIYQMPNIDNLTDRTQKKFQNKCFKQNSKFFNIGFEVRLPSVKFRPRSLTPLQIQNFKWGMYRHISFHNRILWSY